MNAPAKIPPKLQQLLQVMQDVDKVTILQLAHQYQMDLDDPSFLPLLLTKEGIKALEESRKALANECEKTISYALSKSADVAEKLTAAGKARVEQETAAATEHLKKVREEAEAQMKTALGTWAEQALMDAICCALVEHAKSVTSTAEKSAKESARQFDVYVDKAQEKISVAVDKIEEAASNAESALRDAKLWQMGVVLIIGIVIGACILFVAGRKTGIF